MYIKSEVRRLFELGKKYDATHLIIFYNSYDYESSSRYVTKGETVDDVINGVLKYGPAYKVQAIFNYDLDLEEQLQEDFPNHREPSTKYKTNYELALEYATKKHKGQVRKGNSDIEKEYIEHPVEVSNLVDKYLEKDYDKETYKIVALLHDTIEDTDATYDEIKKLFGETVANMVYSLSNNEEMIKKYGKDVYLSRKLASMNENTLTIKLCDRLCNIKDLVIVDNEFKTKYINETMYIINYLMINKELNEVNLKIINDILLEINKLTNKINLEYDINKKILEFK